MSISMPTSAPPASLRERVNFRVILFVGVFALLLGWPLYLYLDSMISGGLKNHGDYFEVDLKAMSDFRFNQSEGTLEDIPQRWRDLDNKTVVMEGEIAPSGFSAVGTGEQFDLVYSVQKCCFSGTPQIQHFVKVTVPRTAVMDAGGGGAVRVKGKLHVSITHDETGKIVGVYHILADGVTAV